MNIISTICIILLVNFSQIFSSGGINKDLHPNNFFVNQCPDSEQKIVEKAEERIKSLLSDPALSDRREARGISSLTPNDVMHLNNQSDTSNICPGLNQIINEWFVDDQSSNFKYVFIKVDSFYFIVWIYDSPSLGFTPAYMFDENLDLKAIWPV